MNRRDVIPAVAGTALLLSGCHSPSTETAETPAVALADLSIENTDDEEHTVAIDIEHDGETIHSASHTVDAGDGAIAGGEDVSVNRPEEPGTVIIEATADGGTREVDLTDQYTDGCIRVMIWIEDGGTVDILTSKSEDDCLE